MEAQCLFGYVDIELMFSLNILLVFKQFAYCNLYFPERIRWHLTKFVSGFFDCLVSTLTIFQVEPCEVFFFFSLLYLGIDTLSSSEPIRT
jgi:hypothetical protein